MKKHEVLFAVIFVALIVLTSCVSDSYEKDTYESGYDAGYSDAMREYEDKYSDGYHDGYYDGIAKAQLYIESRLEDDIYHLSYEIEEEYGISPYDAIHAIANYVDIPGEVTESEFTAAVWAIHRYYFDLWDIVGGVKDYWID